MFDRREPETPLSSTRLMDAIRSPDNGSVDVPSRDALEAFVNKEEAAHRLIKEAVEAKKVEVPPIDVDALLAEGNVPRTIPWWMRPFAKTTVGLEITGRAVRVVLLRRLGNRSEVRLVDEVEILGNGDDESVAAEYLRDAVSRLKLRRYPVISIVGGPDVSVRLLKMPKVSRKEIHDALLWKNKKELHFFNDAPTVLHYVILDDDGLNTSAEFRVLVIAVKEERIRQHLELMQRVKLQPSKLVIRPAAKWELIKKLRGLQQPCLMIDVGYDHTELSFFEDDTLYFSRDIGIGGQNFTSALTQTIFVDNRSHVLLPEEAEAIKRELGLLSPNARGTTAQGIPYSEIAVLMRPVAEKLVQEIKLSMDYYAENFKASALRSVLLTGNGVRMKRWVEFISSHLTLPVDVVQPMTFLPAAPSVPAERRSQMTSFLNAVGAAMSTGSDLNFLPKTQIRDRQLAKSASWIFSGNFLLAVAIGAMGFLNWINERALNRERDTLLTALSELSPHQRMYDDLVSAGAALDLRIQHLKKETQSDSTTVTLLKMISNVTPEEIVLDEIRWGSGYNETEALRQRTAAAMAVTTAKDSTLEIKGTVYKDLFYADMHLLNFISGLEQTRVFSTVELREKNRDATTEQVRFTLQAR